MTFDTPGPVLPLTLAAASALATALMLRLMWKAFRRYALARPNARSMHTTPTPQGGGIAVIAVFVVATGGVFIAGPDSAGVLARIVTVLGAVAGLAFVGALDDLYTLPVIPRLAAQAAAAACLIVCLPDGMRALPAAVPFAVERGLEGLAVVWFVNLTNFMDGIDWMTVAEFIPVAGAIAVFWTAGWVAPEAGIPATALAGAVAGFAPFNRPVARLFLGDVGSLAIGLAAAWMLLVVAEHSLAAALLLPLYYIVDATFTILARLKRRERIHEAHRTHFYQRAVSGGTSVLAVVGAVFALNCALAVLAAFCLASDAAWVAPECLLLGAALTAGLMAWFQRKAAP